MKGLSLKKRTASTSSSIFAVNSAITALSGKPVIFVSASVDDLPRDGLAATIDQGALVGTGDFDFLRRGPGRLFQRDRLIVRRQTIMLRSVERGKRFELVERAFLFEHLDIGFKRDRGVEHAGNAVGRHLARIGMRRGIGAEEITSLA